MLRRIRTRCRLLAPAAALAVMLLSAWPTGLALCLQTDGCLDVELMPLAARSAGGPESAGCISDHCHAEEHQTGPAHHAAAAIGDDHAAGCRDFTVPAVPALVTQSAPVRDTVPAGLSAAASPVDPGAPVVSLIPDPASHPFPGASGPPPGLLPALTAVRSTVRLC